MYHQWSPYAGARPSTSSHASCWMSVTPGERDRRHRGRDREHVARVLRDVVHQGGRAGAADVLDPAADDVDQAALALVGAGAGGLAGRLERRARRRRRHPASWPSIASAACASGEAGVERHRLLQLLLGPRLQPHQALEPGVVRRGGLGRGRQRQPERVARPGDRVVPADEPAVGQPPGQRGDLVEHRQSATCAAWVRISGIAVDSHSSPRRTRPERPDRRPGRAGRVDEPARRRCCSPSPAVLRRPSATPPRGVSRSSDSGSPPGRQDGAGAGAVHHPADLADAAVGERHPQAATGERLGGGNLAGRAGQHRRTRSSAGDRRRPSREASGGAAVPRRWRRSRRNSCGRPRRAAATAACTTVRSPSTAGRQSPVARCDPGDVLDARGPGSPPRLSPQSSISGIAASWSSSACRFGSSPCRETAWRRRSGRCDGPVSESTTSTMVRPVPTSRTSAGPAASRRTTSRAPGAHGSGTKNAESRSASGAQPTPGGVLAGGQDDRVAGDHLAVVGGDDRRRSRRDGCPWPARAGAAAPTGTSPREGLRERLVEVAAPVDPRREDAGLGHQLGVLPRPPGDEVPGVLGQRAHAAGRRR